MRRFHKINHNLCFSFSTVSLIDILLLTTIVAASQEPPKPPRGQLPPSSVLALNRPLSSANHWNSCLGRRFRPATALVDSVSLSISCALSRICNSISDLELCSAGNACVGREWATPWLSLSLPSHFGIVLCVLFLPVTIWNGPTPESLICILFPMNCRAAHWKHHGPPRIAIVPLDPLRLPSTSSTSIKYWVEPSSMKSFVSVS